MVRRKKVKRTMRPGCAVGLFLFVIAILVMLLTPLFDIDTIEVVGNERISSEVILSAVSFSEGDNLFMANTSKAEKAISAMQFVEDVKVKRIIPGKIKIVVTEGTVAAYINHGENFVGINLSGKTLCFIDKASAEENITAVYGLSVEECSVGQAVVVTEKRNFATCLEILTEFEKEGLLKDITHLDVKENSKIAFRYRNELKVEFGPMDNVEYKFAYLVGILDSLGENPVGLVNMQNPENITYRSSIE